MVKRGREADDSSHERAVKRSRPSAIDRLSALSDELVLRVLSYLSVPQLVKVQRLSHKYRTLAGDSQIWKSHYYNRFVRPRASRLPGIRDVDERSESLHFASKASRWLDEEHLIRKGNRTNWKRQYKLRHNWAKGTCAANEIEVAEQASIPPVVVQLHDGVIYMADQDGLRAWSARNKRRMIAQTSFKGEQHGAPTALSVNTQEGQDEAPRLVIGFEDGAFAMYTLQLDDGCFIMSFLHPPSTEGLISTVALAWPYAVTMTATQILSIYRLVADPEDGHEKAIIGPPQLLHSLRSRSVWPPLSTALRLTDSGIIISIAYALPTYLSGWTVGIQEVRIDQTGHLLESRLASAIDQHYRSLAFASPPMLHHLPGPSTATPAASTNNELRQIHSKPTSLSYTHPYLLVSHPDNTLTLYLVTSTGETLSISAGSRLWGHTSSVSGAHVGGRGKAVSVSRRGDELRVWELEGGFASSAAKKRLASGSLSVQLRPEAADVGESSQSGFDLVNKDAKAHDDDCELTLTRGWIGFDDENVVVLKEESHRQALVVYDFT